VVVAVRQPPDSERRPAATRGADPTPPPTKRETGSIVADPAGVVAAELAAIKRGDVWPCACCTSHEDRRPALDRLHDQDQRTRIARALDRYAPLTTYYHQRGRVA
jgi:hypothetical protein